MMKKCTKCGEIKELCEFGKRSRHKDGLDYHCKSCTKEERNKSSKENNKRSHEYYKANKSTVKEYKHEYYVKNKIQLDIKSKEYGKTNTHSIKLRRGEYQKDNPDIMNAISAKRRAAKIKAIDVDLTKEQYEQIKEFYKQAQGISKLTGVKYEVDHIIPLQAKDGLNGLHVPWNLQIITKKENIIKRNNTYTNFQYSKAFQPTLKQHPKAPLSKNTPKSP